MSNQTISTTVSGPIFSNGGAITVTNTGKIIGKTNGGDGVEATAARARGAERGCRTPARSRH
jgi:hypothetical protein